MKTIKETLELALEVLITINNAIYVNSQQEADAFYKANDAITALRVALASQGEALTSVPDWASEAIEQPAPAQQSVERVEPVAWMYQCSADNSGPVLMQHKQDWAKSGSGLWTEAPLYTSPPAQRQRSVKPLTNEEIDAVRRETPPSAGIDFDLRCRDFARAIEAKLREKNT